MVDTLVQVLVALVVVQYTVVAAAWVGEHTSWMTALVEGKLGHGSHYKAGVRLAVLSMC